MKQLAFLYFDMRLSRINKTGIPRVKLHNTVGWNGGFTLIELTITVAMVGILAAIALPNYSDYIDRTKLVACYGDIRILNLEYTTGQTGDYSSAADLKDDLLDEYEYTEVSDGVYQCPSCDDGVYANVSIDDDDNLETSCSLDDETTTDETTTDEAATDETATDETTTDDSDQGICSGITEETTVTNGNKQTTCYPSVTNEDGSTTTTKVLYNTKYKKTTTTVQTVYTSGATYTKVTEVWKSGKTKTTETTVDASGNTCTTATLTVGGVTTVTTSGTCS